MWDNPTPFGASPRSASRVISLARYSALLAQPALRSAIAASVLGRLPIGIAGLSILMLALWLNNTGSAVRPVIATQTSS